MTGPTKASLASQRSSSVEHPGGLRILIVRIGAMGDVLHAMPAVAGLRAALPDCYLGWAVEPVWMPLLLGDDGTMPMVDRVHTVPTKAWKRHPFSTKTVREIAALRREIRTEAYDVCIDLQGSMKSAVVGWMSGSKRFIGPANPRESLARTFYSQTVMVNEPNVIEQACELAGAAVGVPVAAAAVELPTSEGTMTWSGIALQRIGAPTSDVMPSEMGYKDGDGSVVLIVPTAGWGAKEWGTDRYGELAKALLDRGYRVLVNAAGVDSQVAAEIAAVSGAALVPSTIPQLIALTRRASLVIGGDTGPVHLAAALGRPVVALFGPTDPARNGPAFPGSKVTVLRDSSSVTSHKRHAATEAGLQRIRVEEVLAAALAMLEHE